MTGRASSASSFSYQWTYDVFLNFRGEDTRNGFIGNLFDALRRKGIRTFMDDGELKKGDEITPSLFKAIEESRMAITVFSKNYASSTFCLDELVKILRCIKGNDRSVWPIFYDVEPSDVRHQKGNYEEALAVHQKNSKANEEKVQNWKLALREAANLSGLHFNPAGHEYECHFIEKIVIEISTMINRTPLHIAKYPVGLESRVPEINHLLRVGSNDEVIMVGIFGIGGMGKTTIARAVYNSIADHFEGLCFLHDIKDNSRKLGLEKMQERMLSKTLGVDIKVEDVNEGVPIIKRRLNQKKILLILDNVDKQEQLETLAGNCNWFGSGSRIIITTRDKHLLARHGVERLYGAKEFNNEESLELLSWNAFKNNQVDPSYVEVLNYVVQYAKGLPLALEVIGSHFFDKSIEEWKSAIDIYKRIPNEEVQKILKVSYDGLGEVEKQTFLDIASFFIGANMEYVKDMVQHARGFNPSYGIGVLMNKCLINYDYGCVEMHDLIQDMGREVVRQESPNEPGKRSRLWNNEDIAHVLENNTGTDTISVIIQDNLLEDIEVNWNGKAFKKMKNLKIVIFKKAYFSEGPKYLPNSLRVLQWPKYPSSGLPVDFHATKLAILDLQDSSFQLLKPVKRLENLSVLDLSYCFSIKQIPDISGIPNLLKFSLDCCQNLTEIHESVGYLQKLEFLSAESCRNLRTFPHGIMLPSLKDFKLRGCFNLEKFPEILEEMKYIRELDLSYTAIEKLPLSIQNLSQLLRLEMKGCRGLQLPSSIAMLPKLWRMSIQGCRELQSSKQDGSQEEVISMLCSNAEDIILKECNILDEFLPICLTWFANVKHLDLSGNNFTDLPAHIKDCHLLQKIILNDCKHLREIRGIPPNILVLSAINCTSLSLESTNILLSRELHEAGHKEFCVPGARIPELFEHCSRGPSIYFWFRNKFPAISLCSIIPVNKSVYRKYLWAEVMINGKEIFNDYVWNHGLSLLVDHIFVYNLRQTKFPENKMDYVFLKNMWNHVEICMYTKGYNGEYEIGINVIKAESRMEDIQFNNPYKRRKLESLNWDSVFMASSRGVASDKDLQQQQDLNRKNLTWDPMEWEFSVDMPEDQLDLNDQAGTISDKGQDGMGSH